MEKVANSAIELIGKTPLVELHKLTKEAGALARVLVKVEAFNPAGSVKDRVALAMVEQAERDGILKPGATIVEPTSGNTGVGLALVAALKGYKLILTIRKKEAHSPVNVSTSYVLGVYFVGSRHPF